jgi:WD40 repeat protein
VGGSSAGGTTGAGGNSPNGPPSLAPATCHEYVHSAGTSCTLGGANDWPIYTVSVAPNGTLVASSGGDARTKIWLFDGHTLTAEGHVIPGTGFSVSAFSPDGTMLAIGGSTGVDIYNVSNLSIRLRTLTTAGQVYDLAWTPDSQQVMSIDSGTLYAHAVGTITALHSMVIAESTWAIAVSPVASTTPAVAVATQSGTVRVFTHSTSGFTSAGPTLTVDTTGFNERAQTVKFSPDGKLLAAAANDDTGAVHVWNYPLTSATPTQPDVDVATPANSDIISAVAFHPAGKYIGVGAGLFQSMSIFNTAAPRSIVSLYNNPSYDLLSVTFSPSGAALLGGEDTCGLILVCAD